MCSLTAGRRRSAAAAAAAGARGPAGSRSPSRRSTRLRSVVAEPAGDADDHARRLVPAVEVVEERLARRGADGLLAADDVPAERLVAVEELLVHAADVVARRVEVHVHLLDDHALLALDLLGSNFEWRSMSTSTSSAIVAVLGRALDVVARVLLAGERVELAADGVDLAADVARGRPPLGALEEHVLGEVRDAVRVRASRSGSPAASMTKQVVDATCGIGAVRMRRPLSRVLRSKTRHQAASRSAIRRGSRPSGPRLVVVGDEHGLRLGDELARPARST